MEPIRTKTTNLTLVGPEGSDVIDLPATRIAYGEGTHGLESCWKLTASDLAEVQRTGVVYLICLSDTHPPVCLSPYSSLSGRVEGQYDTGVNPVTICRMNPGPQCELCQEDACQGRHR